jgi:predicted nucleic acid-binding protein
VKTVLDTSVLVNCSNGGVLAIVFRISKRTFVIPPAVATEFEAGDIAALQEAGKAGRVTILNDADVPGALYLRLLADWGLGEGETECIAFASHAGIAFAADDRFARRRATELLGVANVSGSLGLLKEAVAESLITKQDAYAAYEQMRAAGGFLPDVALDFFDS